MYIISTWQNIHNKIYTFLDHLGIPILMMLICDVVEKFSAVGYTWISII